MRKILPLAALLAAAPLAAFAQAVPEKKSVTPTNAADGETITLSAFTVSTTATSSYQSQDATSAGRIRMKLTDTPESISVITRSFMDDIGVGRILDALQYSAGISESTIPDRLDRLTVRGFQQDPAQNSQFIDGFRFSAISAGFGQEQANIERMEVVKGPNGIIAAAGSPGGSVNVVTKAPKFNPAGSLRVQWGEYLSRRAELDVTGPLPVLGGKAVAYRLVAMYTNSDGYLGNQFAKSYFIAPSLTWRIGADTEITFKGNAGTNQISATGIALDPRVGTTTQAIALYPGFGPTQKLKGKELGAIPGNHQMATVEATHKFSEAFQTRFGFQVYNGNLNDLSGQIGGNSYGSQVGGINPNTGQHTPGTNWTVFNYGLSTQTVTSSAAALPDFTNRTTGYTYSDNFNFSHDTSSVIQNDFVYKADLPAGIRSDTVAGWALTTHSMSTLSFAGFSSALVGGIDNPDFATTFANLVAAGQAAGSLKAQDFGVLEATTQGHVAQLLHFFSDRLILSGSVTAYKYSQSMRAGSVITSNPLGTATRAPAGYSASSFYVTPGLDYIAGRETNFSYGVVAKVIPDVSLYFSSKKNVNPPTINNIGGTAKLNQYGDQYEFGAKTSLFKDTVTVSAAYFDIKQHNVFVYDGVSQSYLSLGDANSKGFEFEANAKLAAGLNLVAQWSDYKARDGFGRKIRGVADESRALAVRYGFNDGVLKNLWFLVGANYLGKRPGDFAGSINIDRASAKPGVVPAAVNGRDLNGNPVEPTFYLQGRTILALTSGYSFNKNWALWLKVDNLMNKKYIGASLNRGNLFPGTPRNFTSSVTYKF